MDEEVLKQILDHAHAVAINMNDTFYYACADSSVIDVDELEDLTPVIKECGYYAFVGYEAIKRGHDPITPRGQEPKFHKAKQMIHKIMEDAEEYGEFYELRETVKMEVSKPKERKKLSKLISKTKDSWFSFFGGR